MHCENSLSEVFYFTQKTATSGVKCQNSTVLPISDIKPSVRLVQRKTVGNPEGVRCLKKKQSAEKCIIIDNILIN